MTGEAHTLCIGHRGAPRRAPENTLASFAAALDLGVDGIELDVHLTSDGQVVVIHDSTLGRTTDGAGLVADCTLKDLRLLDAGGWFQRGYAGERIPLLAEVVELVRGRCLLQVEIKGTTPGIAAKTAAVLREGRVLEETLVTSFVHAILPAVREAEPRLRTGVLISPEMLPPSPEAREQDAVNLAYWARADAIDPHFSLVTPTLVEAAHQAGLEVATWTVDAPEDMRRLIAAGVDRMTTNLPDVLVKLPRAQQAQR